MKKQVIFIFSASIVAAGVVHHWKLLPEAKREFTAMAVTAALQERASQVASEQKTNPRESASIVEEKPKVAGAPQTAPAVQPVLPPVQIIKPLSLKKAAKLAAAAQPKPAKIIGDPIARIALSWVGADRVAEAYWVEAINDATLSAHERQDLIEDLNEDGFVDPHHPTIDDLPLIVSRLELIEELEADAMDEVNSDAFAEAKKDLLNMALASQQN